MDPMTALAVANVVVSGVSMAWNYFAGQDQIKEAKKRKKAAYDLQKGQIDTQYSQGAQDIATTAGNETAVMAAKGVEGPFAGMAVQANAGARTSRLDQWKTGAMSALDLGYQSAIADLNAASDQLNMDTLMGSIGIGLSAAGTMVNAGIFNQRAQTDIFAGNGGGNFQQDYTWSGGRPSKTKLRGGLVPSL